MIASRMFFRLPAPRPLALCVALALAGCAGNLVMERSQQEFATGDRRVALKHLEDAVRDNPRNAELKGYYYRQRDLLVVEDLAAAEKARADGRPEEAARLYTEVLQFDAQNPRARAGLEQITRDQRRDTRLKEAQAALAKGDLAAAEALVRAVTAETPANAAALALQRDIDERMAQGMPATAQALQGPLAKPVTLEFRDAPLRVVFEALSRAAGLNFVFDRDVKAESRVTLFVRNSTVDEVLKLLTATQQVERKVLNANSVLIYPATPAKQKEYQELVTRSFYLTNSDAKQAMTLVKQLVKTKDVFVDDKLNLMVVKDTPDAVRMTERLVASLDVAEPEVMLEVEVLEISRNKLQELGIEWPNQVGYGLLTPTTEATTSTATGVVGTTTTFGGALQPGYVNLRNTGALVPFVANPAAVLHLRSDDGNTTLLANPRIRVKNREKAKVHIGDKLPVFTTTSTANVGVSASVTYLDVGLKLEVEPAVTLDDEVGIKVALDVSNIVKEVPGPSGSLAYQVGTRSATTVLRLKNGETQVLAGLISDEDRSTASRLPGLGNLPILGRLFSNQRDSGNKTEIVLLITPRIVRNVVAPALARADLAAGTENSIGTNPLRLRPTAPNSLGLRGEGGARAASPAALPPPAPTQNEAPIPPQAVPVEESANPVATLIVPPGVRQGETFTATLRVEGLPSGEGGEVLVDFDSERFESASAVGQRGPISVPLQLSGGQGVAELTLRVRPGTSGSGSINVSSITILREGAAVRLPVAASAVLPVLAP
jgi:general secretion pathway protein D